MKLKTIAMLTLAAAGSIHAEHGPMVFASAGGDNAGIQTTVDAFRAVLGATNPPGPQGNPDGRREVNWDGVPDGVASPNSFPVDFFNRNSQRGLVYSSPSSNWVAFQVSANESAGPVRFDNLNPTYSTLFRTFSGQRLFISTGSNVADANFFVSGTDIPGQVSAFGAVFTNVVIPFTTSVEYFNADGVSLGKFFVPPAPRGLSFLGVAFPGRMIAKVRITSGTSAPGPNEDLANGVNIVAMDDFIYGEPVNRCAQ